MLGEKGALPEALEHCERKPVFKPRSASGGGIEQDQLEGLKAEWSDTQVGRCSVVRACWGFGISVKPVILAKTSSPAWPVSIRGPSRASNGHNVRRTVAPSESWPLLWTFGLRTLSSRLTLRSSQSLPGAKDPANSLVSGTPRPCPEGRATLIVKRLESLGNRVPLEAAAA